MLFLLLSVEVMMTYDLVMSCRSWPKAKEKSFLGGSPPRGRSQLKLFCFAPPFIGIREDLLFGNGCMMRKKVKVQPKG